MAPNGPPGDFNNRPTQHADYDRDGYPPPPPPTQPPPTMPPPPHEQFGAPDSLDPLDDDPEPTPWYRKPLGFIAWALLVVILIGLIVYGIVELIHGGPRTSNTPTTTTIPSTSTPTTTTPPSSAPTTTPSTSPPTSSGAEPPPQPTQQPTYQPTHRHHLPPLPSVITIPEVPTVITLPPGLP